MSSTEFPLGILSQQPRINCLYTHLTLSFALSSHQTDVLRMIERGCKTLSTHFPWTSGKVVFTEGEFRVRYGQEAISFVVKGMHDLRFGDLENASFAPDMLPESRLAPCSTVASADATKDELPVLRIQVNLISKGVLLTFAGQHGILDMTSLGQTMYLFSKACRNEPFTDEEISIGNSKPSDAFVNILTSLYSGQGFSQRRDEHEASLRDSTAQEDQEHQVTNQHEDRTSAQTSSASDNHLIAETNDKSSTSATQNLMWTSFTFNKSSLSSLKEQASKDLAEGNFVSTDDVLTAFVWRAMTRARTKRSQNQPVSTTLSRNVDMRRFLSLSSTYPGLIVQSTTHKIPVNTLLNQSLSQIATDLRRALDKSSLTQQFEEQVATLKDSTSGGSPRKVPELEVRLSSWSKEKAYELDFGFGKPVNVQRPTFSNGAREGLVYLLPKNLEGDIDVNVCLSEDDTLALKEDRELREFAQLAGLKE